MYLIDTHIMLWAAFEPHKLSTKILNILRSDDVTVFVSLASLWELRIKRNLGKLSFYDDLHMQIEDIGYQSLNITSEHILALDDIPMIHKDPFDRMLIAQAIYEKLTLITDDKNILKYDISIVNNMR
jgi:PIN domain nuclease of toxin-antitoxin system